MTMRMSGSATMAMFGALYDARGIRFIVVHDKQRGPHSTDGFVPGSGRAGLMNTQRGESYEADPRDFLEARDSFKHERWLR